MFSNQVTLRSGGYLVINQTEALVAIDVNSGRSTREHNIEDTALRTNCEAADEIARQLRLRDLAGLIVVDFIDMEENRNNRTVERRLKEALKNDRARIQVGRISHFGLLEMSRQRIRTGVLEGSTVPCPHCAGAGTVRSTSSIALHVLRVLEDALIKSSSHNIVVHTRTPVALYILNQKRAHLRNIEERFGVSISVAADDGADRHDYHAIERGEPARGVVESVRAQPLRMDFMRRRSLSDEELADEEALDEDVEAEARRGTRTRRPGEKPVDEEAQRRRRRPPPRTRTRRAIVKASSYPQMPRSRQTMRSVFVGGEHRPAARARAAERRPAKKQPGECRAGSSAAKAIRAIGAARAEAAAVARQTRGRLRIGAAPSGSRRTRQSVRPGTWLLGLQRRDSAEVAETEAPAPEAVAPASHDRHSCRVDPRSAGSTGSAGGSARADAGAERCRWRQRRKPRSAVFRAPPKANRRRGVARPRRLPEHVLANQKVITRSRSRSAEAWRLVAARQGDAHRRGLRRPSAANCARRDHRLANVVVRACKGEPHRAMSALPVEVEPGRRRDAGLFQHALAEGAPSRW